MPTNKSLAIRLKTTKKWNTNFFVSSKFLYNKLTYENISISKWIYNVCLHQYIVVGFINIYRFNNNYVFIIIEYNWLLLKKYIKFLNRKKYKKILKI